MSIDYTPYLKKVTMPLYEQKNERIEFIIQRLVSIPNFCEEYVWRNDDFNPFDSLDKAKNAIKMLELWGSCGLKRVIKRTIIDETIDSESISSKIQN